MKEKHGPCIDKNCSWCCNPVKVRAGFPESKIPKNKSGEPIWHKRAEILVPEEHPDTVRLETYDCDHLDHETGRCKEYEDRPEICKSSGCVDETSSESEGEQYKKTVEQKFLKIVRSPESKK